MLDHEIKVVVSDYIQSLARNILDMIEWLEISGFCVSSHESYNRSRHLNANGKTFKYYRESRILRCAGCWKNLVPVFA